MSTTINIYGPATITAAEATSSAPALPVPVDHSHERTSQGSLRAELCDVLQMDDDATDESLIQVARLNATSCMVLNNIALTLGYQGDEDEPVVDLVKDLKRERDELRGQAAAIGRAIGYGDDCTLDLAESVVLLAKQADADDQEVITLKKQIAEGQKERAMIAAALRWPVGGEIDLLLHAQRVGGEVIRLEEELRLAKQDRAQRADELGTAVQRAVAAEKRADELTAQAAQLRGDLARVGEELAKAQASPSGVDARQLPDEPRQEPNPGSPDSPAPSQAFQVGETVLYTWPSGEHFAICKVLAYNPEQKTYELTDGSSRMGNVPAASVRAADDLEIKRLRDAGLLPPEGEQEEKTKRRRRTKAEIEAEKAAKAEAQEPATEPQESPVEAVTPEQAPGTGLECREFILAYVNENSPASLDAILNETFGRFTTEQVEWQLKHLDDEGLVLRKSAGDNSPVFYRTEAAPAPSPADVERATRHQGPLEAERPLTQPNPAAPAKVQAVTKAIALLKQLPSAEFEPGEPVMTVTEEGEIVSGVIEKAFPGTTKLQVKTQAGMQHPDADLVRSRRLIYTTPGGDEVGCLVDQLKEGVAAVTFDGGNYSPGVPLKSLRAYEATTAKAS